MRCRPGGYHGWVYGWVYREGYTGYYPPTAQGRTHTSEAGPGSPAGAGVGGYGAWVRVQGVRRRDGPGPTLRVRSVTLCPPWSRTSQNAASGPIKARFQSFLYKVSQKAEVSPKSTQKASHSPYIQNGLQKSPLDFLRFPFLRAFSHKELMGHFRPYTALYCQNDEVSPDVHTFRTPDVTRNGRQIPPHIDAASCLCRCAPHLTQRGILIGHVYSLKLGIFWVLDV